MDFPIKKGATLGSKSAKCAERILLLLSNELNGVSTSDLNQQLRLDGFGSTVIINAKNYLLSSGDVHKIGKPGTGVQYQWYLKEFTPALSTGQIERNSQSLCNIYGHLPWDSSFKEGWFVYIFKRDRDGIVKIGITSNLYESAKTITYSCGSTLTLCSYLDCNSRQYALEIELKLHTLFDKHNIIGEWFEVDASEFPSIAEIMEAHNGQLS